MNQNYQRGARFERSVLKTLEENGYAVLRTAGSHGAVDIVAINNIHTRLIQCKVTKSDNISLNTYKNDVSNILNTPCPSNCMRELWIKRDRARPYKVLIL